MSEFSKADAEALGWAFVHEQEETTVDLGDGISRHTPASYRAERYQGGNIINEQAETPELLLERIRLYEEHLDQKGVKRSESFAPEGPAGDPYVHPHDSVHTAEGRVNEKALANLTRHDAVYDGSQMVHVVEGQVVEPPAGAEKFQRQEFPEDAEEALAAPEPEVEEAEESDEDDEGESTEITSHGEPIESHGLSEHDKEPIVSEDHLAVDATPAAEKYADEHNIDLADVEGTGQDGRIVKDDVVAAQEGEQ